MYILVEQWTPKAKWLQASSEERSSFMQGVGQAIVELSQQGVKVISWNLNDLDTSHRAEATYFAVWSFPNLEVARNFEDAVEASGWYEYFEQTNLRGLAQSPEEVIDQHIAL
ncbi:DUF6616 family protein [Meiothermus sp.]|uniref:DUF6616 family protein n=1 Tax=Meiothermus sp. TaxID=1955249 RepID=UPI00307E0CB2